MAGLSGMMGLEVRHPVYGSGKVVGHDGRYLSVLFAESGSTKLFAYPEAFNGYLEIVGGANTEVEADLRLKRNERILQKNQQLLELDQMKKARYAERAGKRPAVKKKAAVKKPAAPAAAPNTQA